MPALALGIYAFGLVSLLYALKGDIGFNPADEGFLWYGVLHTAAGQIPGRDFQAYDPGRYYLALPWVKVFGGGILSLRKFLALVQGIGLWAGLEAASSSTVGLLELGLLGLLLALWLFPFYRAVDQTVLLLGLWVGTVFCREPSKRGAFLAGLFTGWAGWMGRNHGLYALVAFMILFWGWGLRTRGPSWRTLLSVFLGGVFLGYSPMLIMLAAVPGYWAKNVYFMERLRRFGATNVALPVPWPWRVPFPSCWQQVPDFALACFFLLVPSFFVAAWVWVALWGRKRELPPHLQSSLSFGLPYLHYIFSRADREHLALGIFPLLLALPAVVRLASGRFRIPASHGVFVLLLVASWAATGPENPWQERALAHEAFLPYWVTGDRLWLPQDLGNLIQRGDRLPFSQSASKTDTLILPYGPGFYPVWKKDSPVWEIYFLIPDTLPHQEESWKAMETEKVRWVIFQSLQLDGKDAEARFAQTHPLLWERIQRKYKEIVPSPLGRGARFFERKEPSFEVASTGFADPSLPWADNGLRKASGHGRFLVGGAGKEEPKRERAERERRALWASGFRGGAGF